MIKQAVIGAAVTAALAMGPQGVGFAQMDMGHEVKDHGVAVVTVWARATPGRARNGAAYFTMANHGKTGDRLISAASPTANRAELHTHIDANGVMRMRKLAGIDLPPGAKVTLKPGGYHVMLMGLKAPLSKGGSFPLTLHFEKAGAVRVTVEVMGVGAMGAGGMHHGGHN